MRVIRLSNIQIVNTDVGYKISHIDKSNNRVNLCTYEQYLNLIRRLNEKEILNIFLKIIIEHFQNKEIDIYIDFFF